MSDLTKPATVLALDAGQTGVKTRLIRPGAEPVERVFAGVRTDQPLLPQLAAVTREAAAGVPLDALAAGVSGLTSVEHDAGELRALLHDSAPGRVLLAHDSVTSYLGTLGDQHGVVVASGTGSIILAVGPAGVARVDGWGYLMGDAGSGYWLGRAALDAVMRAHDGRGPATALTEVVRSRWPELEDAYVQLQSDPAKVSVIAWFAEAVAARAATDEVAARLCREAAEELALSVVTALRRAGADAAPVVSAIGGVFRGSLVRETFEDAVRAVYPEVRFEAPHGTGLDGAAALADLPAAHPLSALVSSAG
ncbi:MAG TPA: BadF/BadG/BcrA/BcrD ATPase family protein [Protaetiibacter sp.]|nr:BadF/BadG/BcrA/BcrD ATPase family protein [Protaetiibacter sp.]